VERVRQPRETAKRATDPSAVLHQSVDHATYEQSARRRRSGGGGDGSGAWPQVAMAEEVEAGVRGAAAWIAASSACRCCACGTTLDTYCSRCAMAPRCICAACPLERR